ncbi:hypothetical protein BCEN4_1080028 [Burkholderia cenocepacia]|nr:hypothetical protein BCEN4_1080028 [Burkholderia cenocepacia]
MTIARAAGAGCAAPLPCDPAGSVSDRSVMRIRAAIDRVRQRRLA